MNYRMISRTLGIILSSLAGLMAVPALVGMLYGESPAYFFRSMAIAAILGALLMHVKKPTDKVIKAKEGFVIVALGWILMSAIGALPFVFSGDIPNFIDAFFETVSGFTTTGATILNDVEIVSRGNNFWRCFTHWIGGMGVLVFIMAVLPLSGEHSMHIMRAECPGPTVGKLVPRAKQTAKILYLIYLVMTLVEVVFLLLGGMSLYDAFLYAMSTAGTGGFAPWNASAAHFGSRYIEFILAVFMFLFAVNFNLYYLVLLGDWKTALKSEELRWYTIIVLGATGLIALNIMDRYGFLDALHHAFFNVTTIISTTGFCTENFAQWPTFSKWIIILLMFSGGCAGSTCGGLKVSRVVMLTKSVFCTIRQEARPRLSTRLVLEGKRVDSNTGRAVTVFFTAYLIVILIGTALVSLDNQSVELSFTAVLSCISNVGPALFATGCGSSWDIFSYGSKLLMSFIMLVGRLEIFPMLILFAPSTWRK